MFDFKEDKLMAMIFDSYRFEVKQPTELLKVLLFWSLDFVFFHITRKSKSNTTVIKKQLLRHLLNVYIKI